MPTFPFESSCRNSPWSCSSESPVRPTSRRTRSGAGAALGATVLLLYAVHVQGNSDYGDEYRWFSLLLLLVIVSLRATKAAGLATFFLASILGGFFLLVKLSLGAGTVLTLSAACVLTRQPSIAAARIGLLLTGTTLGFAGAWLAHQGTLTGVGAFFAAAADVISGYSSAMSGLSLRMETALCFGAFAAILGGISLASPRSGATMTMLACGAPLFVAWKHAMVLGGPNHARTFMLFGLLVLCLILVPLLSSKRRWTAALLVVPSLVLLAPWFHYRATRTGGVANLGRRLAEPLLFRADSDGNSYARRSLETDEQSWNRAGHSQSCDFRIAYAPSSGPSRSTSTLGRASTSPPTISLGRIDPPQLLSRRTLPDSTAEILGFSPPPERPPMFSGIWNPVPSAFIADTFSGTSPRRSARS